MGMLWDIIQAYIDRSPYPPSNRRIAEELGVSPQTLSNWRNPRDLPSRSNLEKIAQLTSVPYNRILDAALHDTGYRPIEQDAKVLPIRSAGEIRRELGIAELNRAELDELPAHLPDVQQMKADADAHIERLRAELVAAGENQAAADA